MATIRRKQSSRRGASSSRKGVAFIFGSLGDPTNLAVRQYLNDNKIPQMFVAALAESVADPEHYPWTIPLNNATSSEAHVYAKYIVATKPNARIAVLYQNDPVSKIFLSAIREGLGPGAASMIVKEVSFELTDPTVNSQVISLKASGADTFIIGAAPKGAAQAIRKAYDLGWAPDRFVINAASSIVAVMKPAGLEKSKGVITAGMARTRTTRAGRTIRASRNGKPSPQNISPPRISRTYSRSTATTSRS